MIFPPCVAMLVWMQCVWMSSVEGSKERSYHSACNIESQASLPYLSAFYLQAISITGCVSNEAYNKQNVYVLSVVDSYGQHHQVIDLFISPISGHHDQPLIFVLRSTRAVHWRVHTSRISNSTRNLFWLSKNSKITKIGTTIKTKIKKFDMPMSTEASDLESWVRRQPRTGGIITSFAQVHDATAFKIKVGADPSAPSECELTDNLHDHRMMAEHQFAQPLEGCFSKSNEGVDGHDVHIIELLKASEDSQNVDSTPQMVHIDIGRKQKSPNRSLMLILKAAGASVVWHIHTKGIRGKLVIIAHRENDVNFDNVQIAPVTVTYDDLSSQSRKSLVAWVQEKYGPPVSYSYVVLANRLSLTVDGAAGLPEVTHSRDVALDENGNPITPFTHPEKTQVALINAVKTGIVCKQENMLIALRKQHLQAYGITALHLTLRLPSCSARDNGTHFLLSTQLDNCGTEEVQKNGIAFYQNAIFVRPKRDFTGRRRIATDELVMESTDTYSGSGTFAADETRIDDEDFLSSHSLPSASAYHVDFDCPYQQQAVSSAARSLPPELGDVSFHVNFYTDDRFLFQYSDRPLRIPDREPVYVEAAVESEGDRLGVMLYNCWISEDPTQAGELAHGYIHEVLKHGCEQENSFKWLPTDQNNLNDCGSACSRFVFAYKFTKDGVKKGQTFLTCELEPCVVQKNDDLPPSSGSKIRACMSSSQYCMKNKMNYIESLERFKQVVYFGPVVLSPPDISRAGHGAGSQGSQPCSAGASDPQTAPASCPHTVRIVGLETGTVVGIAFAAFLIGVALTGSLWYIHSHTGTAPTMHHLRGRGHGPATPVAIRSNETSGDSTPSSTAPITIHQVHHYNSVNS